MPNQPKWWEVFLGFLGLLIYLAFDWVVGEKKEEKHVQGL